MGCGASTASSNIKYLNGKPTFKADSVVKCFDRDNGLLFRLVNEKLNRWAYYNDTTQYVMHVRVIFGINCDVRAMGNTTLEKLENGDAVASVVVQPGKTELFVEGHINGFKAKMDAVPLPGATDKIEEEKAELEEDPVLVTKDEEKPDASEADKVPEVTTSDPPKSPEAPQANKASAPTSPEAPQAYKASAPTSPEAPQAREASAPTSPEAPQAHQLPESGKEEAEN